MQAGDSSLPNGRPDIVTDQTSAHDPLHGYCPAGWTVADWRARQESEPAAVEAAARQSMKTQVEAMVAFWQAGVPTLDYGNNIRQVARDEGLEQAFAFPGSSPPISARCSAKASAPSAGSRCRATPKISPRLMRQ
ncbi:hypothetical protein ACFSHQ_12665 [Gemmobacter lanyuensis]